MTQTIRIAMWSGPRNISTAMMRAWSSRADTEVVDEPFYAAYLAATGLDHPMAADVIASQSTDWHRVAQDCATGGSAPIIFQKHMSQHMIAQAPLDWMGTLRHAFLLRPPEEVAISFREKWDAMGPEDLGFRRQAELFDRVCQLTGRTPPVVLARDVLEDVSGQQVVGHRSPNFDMSQDTIALAAETPPMNVSTGSHAWPELSVSPST